MKDVGHWDRCISHRGVETEQFLADNFRNQDAQVLLIAGIGFDPRSTTACNILAPILGSRLTGLFVREERPEPHRELQERSQQSFTEMVKCVPKFTEKRIDIFAPDGAVVGGRNAVTAVNEESLIDFTDVIIDFSAMSIGVSFPITRFLFDRIRAGNQSCNLHVLVTDEPFTDDLVLPTACDIVDTIHGFKAGLGLFDNARAARLWLPQLMRGRNTVLDKIHSYCRPHDVCPVLPFPAARPRLADELIEEYSAEFESTWGVDTRNLIYADEKKPLDLYRTLLRIDDARKPVFAGTGGSMIILSPTGSKVLSIGALMAAIDRDFPIAHVESIGYSVDFSAIDANPSRRGEVVHIWLHGDAYLA